MGLVYVAGFAPDEGETLLEIEKDSRDSVLLSALVPLQYPTGNGTETATEFVIDPEKIQEAFAADLSPSQNAILAATQRPIAEVAFAEPTTAPAWKTLPTWAVVPYGRQGRRQRRRALLRRARRGHDRRGRSVPRGHDLATTGRHRRDHDRAAVEASLLVGQVA